MANSLSFKTLEQGVKVAFDPEGGLLISLESDTTSLRVVVESPSKKDEVSFVGGQKKK